jgi:adenylyltransferase/sulfurtransferase
MKRPDPPINLSPAEITRYSRHLALPEVGPAGQLRLKSASVLLIGVGGLGSPAALYLTAAGVGRLGLVEFDEVDATNLQRQILYATGDVGRSKLDAAALRLRALNPLVDVVSHDAKLTRENALDVIRPYDVVVDGTDNFATRYLVNDACVLLGKPNVYGSIYRFEGQATVFSHGDGPCYRCLYRQPPPPGLVPNCAEGGVLGVLPGIIGSIQATEALKVILGAGEGLAGRLLIFDALAMRFREVQVPRDRECPMCGDSPSISEPGDDVASCAAAAKPADDVPEMTVRQLKQRVDDGDAPYLLDVREPHERDFCNIGGHLIPMDNIPDRVGELDPERETIVYCRSGVRSAAVVRFLRQSGFANAANLRGGILAWSAEIDPTVPKY